MPETTELVKRKHITIGEGWSISVARTPYSKQNEGIGRSKKGANSFM